MIHPQENGVRRLQEEVARDPGNLAFVPLADLYRAQGRLDVARRVCVRGLERNPTHVEAHYILGRIYRDDEQPEKAYDEWDIALRLDPLDIASRRAIAFLCLEQGDFTEAEKHLRRALSIDPDDPRLLRAMRFIERGGRRVDPDASYWEGVSALVGSRLGAFARESRVRLVLALDGSGRLLAQHGLTEDLDVAAFASLAAGVHAAAREIARISGQPGFSQLYQGCGEHQIFVGTVRAPAGELLLLSVFGEETTIGLVRDLHRELAERLGRERWPAISTSNHSENLEAELAEGLARLGTRARNGYGGRG